MKRKGISPLIAAVILIAATMSIAAILSFWVSGFVKTELQGAEEAGITSGTKCLGAQFELRSISLEGNTLYLILNNKRSVDLELTNLVLIKSDNTIETKPLNETLKGNEIKAITVEDISPGFLKGEIRTQCPDVSVSFTLEKNVLIGDIDGDCDVDQDDSAVFYAAYPSNSGQPAYDARADFDNDGDVDYYDFLTFMGAYGKTC